MPTYASSSRSKHAACLSGQPPQARNSSARTQYTAHLTVRHGAVQDNTTPERVLGSRAKTLVLGQNPILALLGKTRAFPGQIAGAKELLGKTLQTADGRSFRITGMEIVLPDTADTYAMHKRYGMPADATHVQPRPHRAVENQPLPWDRPAGPLTTFMRPTGTPAPTLVGPTQPPQPLTATEKYVGVPLDVGGKHYGGATSVLEANALTHASKARIGNALLLSVQKFNRMAGSRVLAPSRVLAGGSKLLNATEGAANFSSKFGTKLGYAGVGLSGAKIIYEVSNDKWNAHTIVDGGILAVTVTGMLVTIAAAGTAPVWVPIAGAVILIYGLADYSFDLGGKLDESFGRRTNFWKK